MARRDLEARRGGRRSAVVVLGAAGLVSASVLPSCTDVLGIHDLRRGSPSPDVITFQYVDGICAACVETSCAAEQQACGADASCSALNACLAAVPRDDVPGRAACYDQNEIALQGHPGADLDACRRGACLDACLGTGGVLATHGEDCRSCVDESPACQTAVAACFATAACERKVEYYVYECPDNPECRFRALYDVHNPPTDEQLRAVADLAAEVRRCLTPCDSDCGITQDFSCVGDYEWSHAPVSLDSVTMTAHVDYRNLAGTTHVPAAGVTVDVCAPQLGYGCEVTLSRQVGSDGAVDLELPLVAGRFDGHLYVHGGDAYPTHIYFGRPLWRSIDDADFGVVTTAEVLQALQLAGGTDDTLGHLVVAFYSCWRVLAGGLAASLDAGAGTPFTTYYPLDSTTTASGVGAWFALNVEPGSRALTARFGAGVVIAERAIAVAPAALTEIALFPDSGAGAP